MYVTSCPFTLYPAFLLASVTPPFVLPMNVVTPTHHTLDWGDMCTRTMYLHVHVHVYTIPFQLSSLKRFNCWDSYFMYSVVIIQWYIYWIKTQHMNLYTLCEPLTQATSLIGLFFPKASLLGTVLCCYCVCGGEGWEAVVTFIFAFGINSFL